MIENQAYQDKFQAGKALFDARDFKGAARVFIPLLEEAPEDLDLRQYLTQAYSAFGYYAEAVEIYRPNFEKTAEGPQKYGYFGNLCYLAGFAGEALRHLGKAHELAPDNAEAPSAMAMCHAQLGDMKAANTKIREALKIDPGHIRSLVILADIDAGALSPENIARLTSVIEDENQYPGDRIDVAFALGKAYLKAKDFDPAFHFFQAGNTFLEALFKSQGTQYNPDVVEQQFQDIKSFYTKELTARTTVTLPGTFVPIFIIGLPRSGTTLVEQILSSHSNIYGAGEYKLLGEFYLRLEQISSENPDSPKEEILNQVSNIWRGEYFQKMNFSHGQGITHTTDKMPLNFESVGLAYKIFPNARFIFLRRDPKDTCLSMFFQALTDSYPATTTLKGLGNYYQLFEKYLSHWSEVLPNDCWLEVSYEDLVADQEGLSKKLIDFSHLKWEEACLEFHKNPRSVQTMSNIQVRQKLTGENVGRWKNFEKHLGPLTEALGTTLSNEH